MHALSIIIPAFNEEDTIRGCIVEVQEFMHAQRIEYEIIVVDDGSTDNTGRIVKELCQQDPFIIFIPNKQHAYGLSLIRGIRAATKDYVMFFPSDMQYDIEDVGEFLNKIEQYDYILGYREKIAEVFPRKIFQHTANTLPKLILAGTGIKDPYCDFKLFKREVINTMSLHATGIGVHMEILYNLQRAHLQYTQLPVHHYERKYGKSKGFAPRYVLSMLRDGLRIKLHLLS